MDWSKWRQLFLKSLTCFTLCWQCFTVIRCIYPFVKSSLTWAESISYSNANYILDTQRLCLSWSVVDCSGQNFKFRHQISIRSDYVWRKWKIKKLPQPIWQTNDHFSTVFKCILNKTNYLLTLVVLHISQTDFKEAKLHKSPCVEASGRAVLITVYNPIPDSYSGSFFYLP